MYNFNNQYQIERYQGIPIQLKNNKSLSTHTLQDSLKNIIKYQNKSYLNILITDINYIELIGQCLSFCNIGMISLIKEQQNIIKQFYTDKIALVNKNIKNAYIDIAIINNDQILKQLIHRNYIKYIYSINFKPNLQYYKIYQSGLADSYFYMNRLRMDAYIQLQFIKDKPQSIQHNTNTILYQKELIKNQYISYNKSVNIIIPFYNNVNTTVKLINSIQKYSNNSQYKIHLILISDGSKKQNIQMILEKIKKYKNFTYQIIHNQKRCGYIKSTNRGILRALQLQSQYLILMHNDIEVSYNWQDLLLYINNNTVATCPITNSQYDLEQSIKYIRSNNILQNFPNSFQKCKTLTINQMLSIYKHKNIKLSANTFTPNFFCIAFNTKIFKQLGLLNQQYGQGFGQNVDFIQKIYNNNYNIQFVPSIYIPHIGRNTFKDLYNLKQLNKQVKIKQYFNNFGFKLISNKKKVIYSYANELNIHHNVYNTNQFDYILFTDTINSQIYNQWTVINISEFKQYLNIEDSTKLKEFCKTHPHLLFKNYQQSLWIDTTINIISQPRNIFELLLDDEFLLILKNSKNTSIYINAQYYKTLYKNQQKNINKLLDYLNKNNFKNQTPLISSNLILYNHNNIKCKKLMQYWWKLISEFSTLDQLSFNFCLQKLEYQIMLIDQNVLNNKYIKQNNK